MSRGMKIVDINLLCLLVSATCNIIVHYCSCNVNFLPGDFETVSLSSSPSSAAKTDINKILSNYLEQPIYSHHFAMKLYDQFNENIDDESEQLKKCVSIFSSISDAQKKQQKGQKSLRCGNHAAMESFASAMLARALDRYIYDCAKSSEGAVFHQLCSRKRQNVAGDAEARDISITSIIDSFPERPLLVCDFKKSDDDHETAVIETHGYGLTTFEAYCGSKASEVFLGLACTPHKYSLMMYRPCKKQLQVIKIVEATHDVEKILKVVKFAVIFMIDNPIPQHSQEYRGIKCCDVGTHKMLHETFLYYQTKEILRQGKVVLCKACLQVLRFVC